MQRQREQRVETGGQARVGGNVSQEAAALRIDTVRTARLGIEGFIRVEDPAAGGDGARGIGRGQDVGPELLRAGRRSTRAGRETGRRD